MTNIQYKVEIHDSVTLEPDTTVKLILPYTNLNLEISHYIQSFSLSPTWDLNNTYQSDINTEVKPGETVPLQQVVKTPDGLGGQQGFQVHIIVRESSAESASYERVTSILRTRVRNAEQINALICGSHEEFFPVVHELLWNWGFSLIPVDDQQAVINEFKEERSRPMCVIWMLGPSQDQHQHISTVINTATTAVSNNVPVLIFIHEQLEIPELPKRVAITAVSDNVPVLIFIHEQLEIPELPKRVLTIEVNLADALQLERDAGQHLLAIRNLVKDQTKGTYWRSIVQELTDVGTLRRRPGTGGPLRLLRLVRTLVIDFIFLYSVILILESILDIGAFGILTTPSIIVGIFGISISIYLHFQQDPASQESIDDLKQMVRSRFERQDRLLKELDDE